MSTWFCRFFQPAEQNMKSIQWDGQRISRSGVYAGIPLEDYHRGDICDGPSLSSSSLRLLWSKSPQHFWDKSPLNPDRDEADDEKREYIIGRAAHHLVCGELGFADLYVIRPDKAPDGRAWHGSNTSCIKWLAEQKRLGKTVLTAEMTEQVRGMAVSLGNNSLIRQGILSGLVERSMFWRDPVTGVWLKSRPDVISTASGDFADLKTTLSVLYKDTQKSLDEFGYVQQGALVLDGARAVGLETSTFSLVWVEKKRPHCVRVQTLIEDDLARGAKMNRSAIDTFHACFTAKHWPGPGDDRDDAEYIQLSEAARKRIDDRLQYQLREAA
jgi:PDDEXK-like domain of unknown function (DUF3799)